MFSGGRRRSDRWVAYLIVVLVAMNGIGATYTVQRQRETEAELRAASDRLAAAEQERKDLTLSNQRFTQSVQCLASKDLTVDLAVARYLVRDPSAPNQAELAGVIDQLLRTQEELNALGARADAPCFSTSPSTPPTTR